MTGRFFSGILIFLSGIFLPVFAQDDLFITVSAPVPDGEPSGKSSAAGTDNLFTTVSVSDAKPASPVPPVAVPASSKELKPPAAAEQPVSKKKTTEKCEQELLRDPFWPVGFFPADWKKGKAVEGGADLEGSGWKAAAGVIRVSGTSRLGDRTAAIINGELKVEGDQVEVIYEGATYRWEIVGIDFVGRIQLKKVGIK